MKIQILFTVISFLLVAQGKNVPHPQTEEKHKDSRAPLDEHFGYIDVRPGCHMFYVWYESELKNGGTFEDYPLVMWLQGGPGSSGVGYGNFWELGPYDIHDQLRPHRWTQEVNLLFVDNPVGTGFSYVDNITLLTKTNEEIANDLVELTKQLFALYPEMRTMPYFVWAESYGGKMAADYALGLQQAIQNGDIVSDFRGIACIDSWISPLDLVDSWGPFLYQVAYVNDLERDQIQNATDQCTVQANAGNWEGATDAWYDSEMVIFAVTGGISFYNVFYTTEVYSRMEKHNFDVSHMRPSVRHLYEHHVVPFYTRDALGDFMNTVQGPRWNVTVQWGYQSNAVFDTLAGDFMKSVVPSIESLLNNTNLHVSIVTGNWDLICATPGTYEWMLKMNYKDKESFDKSERVKLFEPTGAYEPQAGYRNYAGQLSVYTILRSGHMVPMDAPFLNLQMVNELFNYTSPNRSKNEKLQNIAKIEEVQELKEEVTELKKILDVYRHKEELEKIKQAKEHEEQVKEAKARLEKMKEIKTHLEQTKTHHTTHHNNVHPHPFAEKKK